MKRLIVFAVLLLLTQPGCLRTFLNRLDRIQGELERANHTLVEATDALHTMESELKVANERLKSVDGFMKRFGGGKLGAPEELVE